jgi:hypothetical protein
MMGSTNAAQDRVNKANDLQLDPDLERQVKAALTYDIELLPKEREQQYRAKAYAFWKEFL